MAGEVVEDFVQMLSEGLELAEQDVRQPRLLEVLPEPLDQVQVWAVVRQPERLNVLFDILEVVMERLRVVGLTLIHHQDDPPSRSPRPADQLL